MLEIWLIRHGMTEGNRHGRYIGVTDEALCTEGKAFLQTISYPQPKIVYVSPLKRCRETAQILFPERSLHIIKELAECDFGDFENKNYQELAGNPDYQAWIDSNGMLPFPNGESREAFRTRNLEGFERAVRECIHRAYTSAAFVVHGGTIMNLMEVYAEEERPFYQWHVKNGGGFRVLLDENRWQKETRVLKLCETRLEG